MRILLRKVNTKLYLNPGDGMEGVGQACNFKSGGEAIIFALEHDLRDVEITYAFPNPEYNFSTGMVGTRPANRGSAVVPGKAYTPISLKT